MTNKAAADWRTEVDAAARRGDLLLAYDIASDALADYPDDPWLRHRSVLVLARAGATEQAAKRFAELGLSDAESDEIAALRARIAKDRSLAATGEERLRLAEETAALYRNIFDRTGDYYPGINAATMKLIAGDEAAARTLARAVLPLAESADDGFFSVATEAEAHLLIDDAGAAKAALSRAADCLHGNYNDAASTRRQLRLICDAKGMSPDPLAALAIPTVIHYCGLMLSEAGKPQRFVANQTTLVGQRIDACLEASNAGFGYGSLACGADILIAEALLRRGGELHVVLPFQADEFYTTSVNRGGPEWRDRFQDCMDKATSVIYATEDSYLNDDYLFTYSARLAMGLALLRARYLQTSVQQVSVWDGGQPAGLAGTAIDVAFWLERGLPAVSITPDGAVGSPANPSLVQPGSRGAGQRVIRAMLFGDFMGFSRLSEAQLPPYVDHVLGCAARVFDHYEASLEFRNTWGDGIFLVFKDAGAAACCAHELQAELAAINLASLGLPTTLGLRLAGHVGPVLEAHDPIRDSRNFFGTHVSRTARIEPVTPEGAVYVTEAFAAQLTLVPDAAFTCDYVGRMPAAKGYGNLRMYALQPV